MGAGGGARRIRWSAAVVVLIAAIAPTPAAHSAASDEPASPAPPETPVLDGLTADLDVDLAATLVAAPPVTGGLAALRPTGAGLRIAIVSSGIDAGVLPTPLSEQVTLLGSAGDPIGYGTYATSVVLQLAPTARVTSIGVYPAGRLDSTWHGMALSWLAAHADEFDAVLYAIPPSDFVDPVSAAMSAGVWEHLGDLIARHPSEGTGGPAVGLPLSGDLRRAMVPGASSMDRTLVDWFATNVEHWTRARSSITAITDSGVAVVAPAGNFGPHPQSILGLANLEDVVTVGGFDGSEVSASSASGPSMSGGVKPDLVAPTGIAGALPAEAAAVPFLSARGLLDPSLPIEWDAPPPATDARARVDSTMTSAAVVAVATASLAAAGIRDVPTQRGALTAASVPLDGVPVWRQGAGVLRRMPDADFAAFRSLALAHGDLGAEPAGGTWATVVPVRGEAATGATVTVTGFLGVGPDGGSVARNLDPPGSATPPVSARVTNEGIELTAPTGDHDYEGGLYCGYAELSVPGGDAAVEPGVDAHGIPVGLEQVPTCLVEGTRLRALGFYIHDQPAEDLTFTLLPGLPVGDSLLHHPLMLLPVNPLDTTLFARVTGSDGYADLPNIPPGYYRVRQFSDYATPVTQTIAHPTTGAPVRQDAEIGHPVGYQAVDTLVLSPVCSEQVSDPIETTGSSRPCTSQFLADRFGAENVEFEKTTGTWMVTVGPTRLRLAFDFLKKMPGPAVASRYIDLVDFEDIEFVGVDAGVSLSRADLEAAVPVEDVWSVAETEDEAGGFTASVLPGSLGPTGGVSASTGVGIVRYPFALTTPNYSAHMSLNFSYEIDWAVLIVAVVVGDTIAWSVIEPTGAVRTPAPQADDAVGLDGLVLGGRAEGRANFEFDFLPRGAPEGTLYLAFVPPGDTALSSASIADLSFSLSTWTNALWPPASFPDGRRGHTFDVDSNYSGRQMDDAGCRRTASSRGVADVCEDWVVMVHSPGDDAATFDVSDVATNASVMDTIRDHGGGFFDPRRGVQDFTHTLVFAGPDAPGVEATLGAPNRFRVNGRFWEQLLVPEAVLAQHPGALQFRIVDNEAGRESALLAHASGPAPLSPYVPFDNDRAFVSALVDR